MIINIRGTSGSGKTTLARRVMERYESKSPVRVAGRRQPIGYVLSSELTARSLAVIGHYETECGGTDTIPQHATTMGAIRYFHGPNTDVLYEGLLLAADVKQAKTLLDEGLELRVVALTAVPLETCLEGVNDRRRRRLGDRYTPVNPKNTESKFRGVQNSLARLRDAGATVHECDREQGYRTVCGWLGLQT